MRAQTTLPPLRVSRALRRKVEAALEAGESLSAFVLEAVLGRLEQRETQAAFVARGLASGKRARASGKYFEASEVLGELDSMLARAQRQRRK